MASIMDRITLAIALLGAVLGVINTWVALDRSRLKLKVVPAHAIPVVWINQNINVGIQVTNLSDFAVTVREVGFLLSGTSNRMALISPILSDRGAWPRRLEPRSAVTVYGFQVPDEYARLIKCAYATTECGFTKKGNSPALKKFASRVGR